MKRLASVRFEGVLGIDERNAAARTLASAGADVTSWTAAAGRTYGGIAYAGESGPLQVLLPAARIDAPPLLALRVVPHEPRVLGALANCLSGRGRPTGVIDARRDGDALVVEIDGARTALALVVAAIDAELEQAPGRSIEPLLPFDDATLSAFAGALLGEPQIDASRLIETHLEPLLGAGS